MTISSNRVDTIADLIANAAHEAIMAKAKADKMKEDGTTAAQNATNAREALMVTLCDTARAGQWTATEIDKACGAVATRCADDKSKKTLTTMLSEVKLAALPVVRCDFAEIVAVRNTLWDEEEFEIKQAKKDKAPAPDAILARVWTRRYQMLVALLREANKQTSYDMTTCDGVLALARANDPDCDPAKLAARVASLADQIEELRALIGPACAPLLAAREMLDLIGEAEVKAAMGARGEAPPASDSEAEGEVIDGEAEDVTETDAPRIDNTPANVDDAAMEMLATI